MRSKIQDHTVHTGIIDILYSIGSVALPVKSHFEIAVKSPSLKSSAILTWHLPLLYIILRDTQIHHHIVTSGESEYYR